MENSSIKYTVLYTVLILVAVVIVLLVGWKLVRYSGVQAESGLYQVVLLRNDQVFYGKLNDIHSDFPFLTDVYYLQPQKTAEEKKGTTLQGNKFTVFKRGYDELHQPTDIMYFPRENILYWENVGPDSLVARGIKADKEWRATQAKNIDGKKP